jgi:hypothetical protein
VSEKKTLNALAILGRQAMPGQVAGLASARVYWPFGA